MLDGGYIGLSASFSEPARQSKDITSRSIGDDDAFNLTSSPNDFLTPSVQKLQEFVLVGLQLLERLALDARDHSRDKPTRLAHLDNDNKRAILVQGGEGSAEIVRLQHRALHRIVGAAPKAPRLRRSSHTIFASKSSVRRDGSVLLRNRAFSVRNQGRSERKFTTGPKKSLAIS